MYEDILLELFERLKRTGLKDEEVRIMLATFLEEMLPLDFYDKILEEKF